ncbi:hypothetical protein FRB90_000537 [Tulasnella sp. 427]|nr:hypothetical protein FRB90_000537 [Tulasnella sp. 427]
MPAIRRQAAHPGPVLYPTPRLLLNSEDQPQLAEAIVLGVLFVPDGRQRRRAAVLTGARTRSVMFDEEIEDDGLALRPNGFERPESENLVFWRNPFIAAERASIEATWGSAPTTPARVSSPTQLVFGPPTPSSSTLIGSSPDQAVISLLTPTPPQTPMMPSSDTLAPTPVLDTDSLEENGGGPLPSPLSLPSPMAFLALFDEDDGGSIETYYRSD